MARTSKSWLARFLHALVEGIELYLALIAAAAVIVFDFLDLPSPLPITSITLAVLTLLTTSLLRLRVTISNVGEVKHRAAAFFQMTEDLGEIQRQISESQTIWLWGGTLSQDMPRFTNLIVHKIQNGAKFKILLLKPGSHSLERAAWRSGVRMGNDQLEAKLTRILGDLEDAADQGPPGALEVRVVDYLAPYSLYAFNPEFRNGSPDRRGKMSLRLTSFKGKDFERPTFELTFQDDGECYTHFFNEFRKVWDVSETRVPATDNFPVQA